MDDSNFTIPPAVLSDLCSRFIINVPEEERADLIRIFFQIEIAHWFYLDFYCDVTPASAASEENDNLIQLPQTTAQLLKPCSIRTFAENIFRHCPFLMQHSNRVDDILSKWKVFKHAVPTNGAIIMDETMRYVLLVQGFWAKASWGFPKGKVVEEESEAKCAIREVLEETGYDISAQLDDDQYLEISINDQTIRLYIVTDVPKCTKFEPRTRREIKEVRWFAIDELPVHRKDLRTKQTLGYSPNSFFMVIPFVKGLKQWISAYKDNQLGSKVRANSQRHHANQHSNHHNHHHHHHTHQQQPQHHSPHHSSNNNNNNENVFDSSDKKLTTKHKHLSKSNESISSLQLCVNHKKYASSSATSKSSNVFLNHNHSKSDDSDEKQQQRTQSVKQQSQYYQKLATTEFAELLSLREAALANKTNKLTQANSTHLLKNLNNQNNINKSQPNNNSQITKFRPIHSGHSNNNENNNSINNNSMSKSKSKSNPLFFESPSATSSAIKKQPQNTKDQRNSTSNNYNANTNTNVQNNYYYNNNNNQQQNLPSCYLTNTGNKFTESQSFTKLKKQLDFSGPECWVNFKFDYDSIVQSLPPLFEL